jgi:hypothetical protein
MKVVTKQLLDMLLPDPSKYEGKSFEKLKSKLDKRGIKIPKIKGNVTEKTLINLLIRDDEEKAFKVIDAWGQEIFGTIPGKQSDDPDEEADEDQDYYHPRFYRNGGL